MCVFVCDASPCNQAKNWHSPIAISVYETAVHIITMVVLHIAANAQDSNEEDPELVLALYTKSRELAAAGGYVRAEIIALENMEYIYEKLERCVLLVLMPSCMCV